MRGSAEYQKALRLIKAGHPRGDPRSLSLLQTAVRFRYPPACYALATWYLHGTGVRKNYKTAFGLLRYAGRFGVRSAFYNLAVCYETGRGTKRDVKKLFKTI
jgi:TPR repeat protein